MAHTPTEQQQAAIDALVAGEKILKIEAVAGSGKTSTLCLMANAVKVPSLYLAFNKVTATEAAEKFPSHVTSKTTHSVAYAKHGVALNKKLSRPKGGYVNVAGTGSEIARFFKIDSYTDHETEVVFSAAHIGLMAKSAVARFEQSADAQLTDRHVSVKEITDKFRGHCNGVATVKRLVFNLAKRLWAERIDLRSPVLATHDTYLKLFQLSNPVIEGYEIFYVDEFQDTTPCVMDIILQQAKHSRIVAVGDARQAIYSWRGAVNALAMLDAKTCWLTKSFRYGQAVAGIATSVLQNALVVEGHEGIPSVVGRFNVVDRTQPHTRLYRTNAALVLDAVEEIQRGTEIKIEADVRDFTKFLESAIALRSGNVKAVKHDSVLPFEDWEEFKQEGEVSPDIARVAKMVESGQADYVASVLSSHVDSRCPLVTFVTAHKSKGREWKQVIVESDFKSALDKAGDFAMLTEEQNLLYVACTRAILKLEYNNTVEEILGLEEDTSGEDTVEATAEDTPPWD